MATISCSRSSARKLFVSILDVCCDLQTRNNILWFLKLKCWPFVLLALVLTAGSVLLLLRFTVTPQIKAYVEDARLNSFNPASTRASFSAYNISISVALTVRNPNGATDITYIKPLVATFPFDNRLLYNVTVADKGHKLKPLKRKFQLLHTSGEVPYVLDTAAVDEFKKQNATGVFTVEMRLSGEITLGIGNSRRPELSCPLTLQRPPPGPDRPKKIVF